MVYASTLKGSTCESLCLCLARKHQLRLGWNSKEATR